MEPTPGLYVQPYLPSGTIYRLNAREFMLDGVGDSGWALAISKTDWLKMQGPHLERFLDEMTHAYAEHGIAGVEGWLATL